MVDPRVSVIVPVRDRRALLRNLLDGLAAQTLTDHEVIVVDDGSTDGTPDEARSDAGAGRPVRVVANRGRGAYAGRRTGVAESRAPYLAFTDSDCVPEPAWLERGVAALEAGADVVNGLTVPDRPPRALERTMASGEEGLYPTCNVFYRRSAYDAAGGFDGEAAARFGFAPGSTEHAMGFGEDTLLGWRVRRAGRAAYVPEAVVRHHVFPPDVADLYRRTWMMVAFPALFREVPELRSGPLVRHGVLLNTPSRIPLYATAVAGLLGRRRLAAAAGVWWLGRRLREARATPGTVAERLAGVPVQLGVDVLTTAVLLVGSARTGTVVL
jgi:glycosyltransferase involved in cell wall biosynthesis